jgi:hypothetical protein
MQGVLASSHSERLHFLSGFTPTGRRAPIAQALRLTITLNIAKYFKLNPFVFGFNKILPGFLALIAAPLKF